MSSAAKWMRAFSAQTCVLHVSNHAESAQGLRDIPAARSRKALEGGRKQSHTRQREHGDCGEACETEGGRFCTNGERGGGVHASLPVASAAAEASHTAQTAFVRPLPPQTRRLATEFPRLFFNFMTLQLAASHSPDPSPPPLPCAALQDSPGPLSDPTHAAIADGLLTSLSFRWRSKRAQCKRPRANKPPPIPIMTESRARASASYCLLKRRRGGTTTKL